MAAAVTATKVNEPLVPITVSGSGLANNTLYYVTISDPQGTKNITRISTDGSGNFSYKYVPQTVGSFTVDVRTDAEHKGTTTPTATTTTRTK